MTSPRSFILCITSFPLKTGVQNSHVAVVFNGFLNQLHIIRSSVSSDGLLHVPIQICVPRRVSVLLLSSISLSESRLIFGFLSLCIEHTFFTAVRMLLVIFVNSAFNSRLHSSSVGRNFLSIWVLYSSSFPLSSDIVNRIFFTIRRFLSSCVSIRSFALSLWSLPVSKRFKTETSIHMRLSVART